MEITMRNGKALNVPDGSAEADFAARRKAVQDELDREWEEDRKRIDAEVKEKHRPNLTSRNAFDRRLAEAICYDLPSEQVSPEYLWFAWYPVKAWSYKEQRHKTAWMETVKVFDCLRLVKSYSFLDWDERPK